MPRSFLCTSLLFSFLAQSVRILYGLLILLVFLVFCLYVKWNGLICNSLKYHRPVYTTFRAYVPHANLIKKTTVQCTCIFVGTFHRRLIHKLVTRPVCLFCDPPCSINCVPHVMCTKIIVLLFADSNRNTVDCCCSRHPGTELVKCATARIFLARGGRRTGLENEMLLSEVTNI